MIGWTLDGSFVRLIRHCVRSDLTARSGLYMWLIYIIYAYYATVALNLPSNLRFQGAGRGNGG